MKRTLATALAAAVVLAGAGACVPSQQDIAAVNGDKVAATSAPVATPPPPAAATKEPVKTAPARPKPPAGAQVRSAVASLAGFFAEVDRADARLRTAAAAYNSDLGADGTLHPSRSTSSKIEAARPDAAGAAIPAGLPPALMRATLAVLNDLDVRWRAMLPRPDRDSTLACLRNGQAAAKRFPAHVAAARGLAAATPAITRAAPSSRAAAEIAVRIADLRLNNGGCSSCGSAPFGGLRPLVWKTAAATGGQPATDGTIRTIPFTATYRPAGGWTVELHAC